MLLQDCGHASSSCRWTIPCDRTSKSSRPICQARHAATDGVHLLADKFLCLNGYTQVEAELEQQFVKHVGFRAPLFQMFHRLKDVYLDRFAIRLFTDVAVSISTRVFTPSRMILRISRS